MSDERIMPWVRQMPDDLDIEKSLLAFSRLPHCLLLESARRIERLGRYSFLMADPYALHVINEKSSQGLDALKVDLQKFRALTVPDLPPFQGGAAGLFTYELGGCYEDISPSAIDEFKLPLAVIGLYDTVVAWDHQTNQCWLIAHGFREVDLSAREKRANDRLDFFTQLLHGSMETNSPSPCCENRLDRTELAPQFPCKFQGEWTSNFASEHYRQSVAKAVEYVHAGDIFQVNLSQRFLHPAVCDSLELYRALRRINPAPFAAYFDLGTTQILSASPERFVQVKDRWVETRPIKGTRHRSGNPQLDLYIGDGLQESRKDRAENVMIVDLLRNDLSRVCKPESVSVRQLCAVEQYQYVLHLVSSVEGILDEPYSAIDLLAASFPGGSITGAPKVRAMEIIAELEPTVRGAYCGSLGYIGFDGSMDLSIAIRTITASRGWWQLQAGGGIVADSQPAAEEEETWHKAEGLVRAINSVAAKYADRSEKPQ